MIGESEEADTFILGARTVPSRTGVEWGVYGGIRENRSPIDKRSPVCYRLDMGVIGVIGVPPITVRSRRRRYGEA